MQSAISATAWTWETSTTSTTNGSPVSRRHSARISSPRSPSPWNEYGDVRGLYTSPRRIVAPAAFAACVLISACSSDSTAHGPAMIVKESRPTGVVPTFTVVVSGCRSRATIL